MNWSPDPNFKVIPWKVRFLLIVLVLFVLMPLIAGRPFWMWRIEVTNFLSIIWNSWFFRVGMVVFWIRELKDQYRFEKWKRTLSTR
jgi:hypothetical protein